MEQATPETPKDPTPRLPIGYLLGYLLLLYLLPILLIVAEDAVFGSDNIGSFLTTIAPLKFWDTFYFPVNFLFKVLASSWS